MLNSNGETPALDAIAFCALGKLSVGIVITRNDLVIYCNEAFESMTGLDEAGVLGKKHPFLEGPCVSDATARRLAAHLDDSSPSASVRVDYVRTDGLPAWNEVQLCWEDAHAVWMHRDITQQMGTHELWQRYEFLLDTSQQYMALVNRDHAYELVNRSFAAAFDTTPEEVNGSSAAAVWGNAMFSAVVAPYLERCLGGEQVQVTHWVDLPQEGHCCLDMIYTPYKDQEGTVIHAVFVAWDVTSEKTATDAVRDANRQLERRVEERTKELQDTMRELEAFNYTIAHDLRSPLRFLKSFTRMLDDNGVSLDEAGRHYVSMISQGVAEMQHMIDRLLDFSRLSRKPVSLECCDLNAVLEAAQRVVPMRETATISVKPLPDCQGDHGLLKQVFLNLLQNAEKFSRTEDAPQINVFAEETDPDFVRICVEDNGIGFHATHAEAMFAPFKQVHDHANIQGSGLGLAIVRRIVERHGGRVWAEGNEGEGARFYVELQSCKMSEEDWGT